MTLSINKEHVPSTKAGKRDWATELDEILSAMTATYLGMLEQFRPCRPGHEFLEQNLVTHFSHAFMNHFREEAPGPLCYSEISFSQSIRMDGYLVGGGAEYFLEAKRGAKDPRIFFSAIEKDLNRIHDPIVSESLNRMTRGDYQRPDISIALILADSWYQEIADIWGQEAPYSDATAWQYPRLNQLKRKVFPLARWGNYNYNILAGWCLIPREC